MEKQLKPKTVEESLTQQIQIVMPEQANGQMKLFGGTLVEWIDVVAAVVARRHSNSNVTTVCIDNLHFKHPAYVNNTIVLIGKLTYVGNTSMEVMVDTYVEDLNGEKKLVNHAYLVMVAIDDEGKPIPVPELILKTDEERTEWELGKKRSELRKQRRIEQF